MPALGSVEQQDQLFRRRDGRPPNPEWVLRDYLRGAYHAEAPLVLNSRQPDATGRQLRDVLVSRLEVDCALEALPTTERRCVVEWFVRDRSRSGAMGHIGCDGRHLHAFAYAGLQMMVARIFEWSAVEGTLAA